jgi:nucleoside-triphosphatase THEP1
MRQLLKPGFWTFFILITILSALAFTALQHNGKTLSEGLVIGVQMNFRAVIIVMGFSSLGTELYNPRIRSLFSRSRFRQLPLAIELSAASLPYMIAMMPDFKTAFRDPAVILRRMVDHVETRLHNEMAPAKPLRKVFIITGLTGEGKTRFIEKLTESLKGQGVRAGGIMAPKITEDETSTGYDIADIATGKRVPFLRHINRQLKHGFERFTVFDEGYQTGLAALDPDRNISSNIVVVDEIGPMELSGQGWDKRMTELIHTYKGHLIVVVRKSLVEEVKNRYGISDPVIYDVGASEAPAAFREITELFKSVISNG